MFEKLLANISFSPVVKKQVGLYVRQLRHEESLRALGLLFIALACLLQVIGLFTVRTPANITSIARGEPATPITKRITISNVTSGVKDANNSVASPHDTITYTLFATNGSKATVTNYEPQLPLADLLQHAVITDASGASTTGSLASWPAATIEPGSTLTQKLTVRVTNPVVAADLRTAADYRVATTYGNTVTLNTPMPSTVLSLVDSNTSSGLPRTTLGWGLVSASVLLGITAFLYIRSRQLVNESIIVMQEANAGKL